MIGILELEMRQKQRTKHVYIKSDKTCRVFKPACRDSMTSVELRDRIIEETLPERPECFGALFAF
jgi:hypothetical protein